MIQAIQNFFDWVVAIVNPLIEFVKSTIHGLQQLITLLPTLFNVSTQAISYVPAIFSTFITISICIFVIYLIVGRDPGD